MRWIHNSTAAQFALIVAVVAAVTIAVAVGTESWLPIESLLVWLPALYVAIYYRSAGWPRRGQRS